jgi:hypothetical protein
MLRLGLQPLGSQSRQLNLNFDISPFLLTFCSNNRYDFVQIWFLGSSLPQKPKCSMVRIFPESDSPIRTAGQHPFFERFSRDFTLTLTASTAQRNFSSSLGRDRSPEWGHPGNILLEADS